MIQLPFDIRIRMATRAECEAYPEANMSFEESAALYVGGELVAMTNEYGTAHVIVEGVEQEAVEKLVELAGDIFHTRLAVVEPT